MIIEIKPVINDNEITYRVCQGGTSNRFDTLEQVGSYFKTQQKVLEAAHSAALNTATQFGYELKLILTQSTEVKS